MQKQVVQSVQHQEQVEDEEDDWHEGSDDNEGDVEQRSSQTLSQHESDEDQMTQQAEVTRQEYVQRMNQRYEKPLNNEVRQRQVQDLSRRNFKSDDNTDRNIDMAFVKNQIHLSKEIKDIKIGNKLHEPSVEKPVNPLEEDDDIPFDQRYIPSSQEYEERQVNQDFKEPESSQVEKPQNTQNSNSQTIDNVIVVSSETDKEPDDI